MGAGPGGGPKNLGQKDHQPRTPSSPRAEAWVELFDFSTFPLFGLGEWKELGEVTKSPMERNCQAVRVPGWAAASLLCALVLGGLVSRGRLVVLLSRGRVRGGRPGRAAQRPGCSHPWERAGSEVSHAQGLRFEVGAPGPPGAPRVCPRPPLLPV